MRNNLSASKVNAQPDIEAGIVFRRSMAAGVSFGVAYAIPGERKVQIEAFVDFKLKGGDGMMAVVACIAAAELAPIFEDEVYPFGELHIQKGGRPSSRGGGPRRWWWFVCARAE